MKQKTINKKNNFYVLLNNLFRKIEDILNLYENEIDIDYEIQDYVMTITFSNNSLIIINKQESLQQIWLATKTNGYHFNYKEKTWICNRTKKNFWEIFENAFYMQSNKKIIFDIKTLLTKK